MPSMDAQLTRGSVTNQIGPGLSEADARAIVELGPKASIFAILTLAKRITELSRLVGKVDPSIGPLRPDGHLSQAGDQGSAQEPRRPTGACGFAAGDSQTRQDSDAQPWAAPRMLRQRFEMHSSRCRIIEDIQADSMPSVTEHVIPRYWCAQCRKKVERMVEDTLPDTQKCLPHLLHDLNRTRLATISAGTGRIFTCLDHEEVPPDSKAEERGIRPAVLIRKNSYANATEKGAQNQAIFMTILRTLKMSGHNPLKALVDALKALIAIRATTAFAIKNLGSRLECHINFAFVKNLATKMVSFTHLWIYYPAYYAGSLHVNDNEVGVVDQAGKIESFRFEGDSRAGDAFKAFGDSLTSICLVTKQGAVYRRNKGKMDLVVKATTNNRLVDLWVSPTGRAYALTDNFIMKVE